MENEANPANQIPQVPNAKISPLPNGANNSQQQNNFQPTAPISPVLNKSRKTLFLVLGVLVFLFLASGIVVWSNNRSNLSPSAPQIASGLEVQFKEVQIRNNAPGNTTQTICYFTTLPPPVKKVIRTQKEYEAYLAEAGTRGYDAFAGNLDNDKFGTYIKYKDITTFEAYKNYCKDQYNFPQFDFNKYTLLGQFTPTGGCSAAFNKKVLRNDKNKTVGYTIDVNPSGGCEMAIYSFNWILVPSIPNDYIVNFEVLIGGKNPPTP